MDKGLGRVSKGREVNSRHFCNYELVAKQYAEKVIIEEEKRLAFLDGVRWSIDAINSTITDSGHPMAGKTTNKMLEEWTLKDIKKAIKKLMEQKETNEKPK